MAGEEPGDRPGTNAGRSGRQLERPPGERYSRTGVGQRAGQGSLAAGGRSALIGPLSKAGIAGVAGTIVLYLLGALLSSSVGLVFVAGLTGASVGLLLARAAAPGGDVDPALSRRQATWSAVAIAVLAVVVAAVGTWLHALAEGGALGLVEYLIETFGAIVPLELVIATLGAAWGAGAGPIER